MRAFVTGATGKVGNAVARALVARGDVVRALVRDPASAARTLPAEVECVHGDVTDAASVEAAVAGCQLVFNAMGLPEQWLPDPCRFEEVNANGSAIVARAARRAGARRLVHTSTIDVFDAAAGERFDETRLAAYPKATPYERSKQRAERLVLAERDGLEVVIVNPASVYGPGPRRTTSLDDTLFRPLVRRRLPALAPGGMGVVFADALARAELLAAERGRDGDRYIVSDAHATLRQLAETVVRVAGRGWVPPTLPPPPAAVLAAGGEALASVTRRPPLLARGQLQYLLWNAVPDSAKARAELGWDPMPLEDGIRRSLAALGLLDG